MDPALMQAFLTEAIGLQSYLQSLQIELSDGLNRVSRVVDLATKTGLTTNAGLQPQDRGRIQRRASSTRSSHNQNTDQELLKKQAFASAAKFDNMSNSGTVPEHVKLGLKWDSSDYISAANLMTEQNDIVAETDVPKAPAISKLKTSVRRLSMFRSLSSGHERKTVPEASSDHLLSSYDVKSDIMKVDYKKGEAPNHEAEENSGEGNEKPEMKMTKEPALRKLTSSVRRNSTMGSLSASSESRLAHFASADQLPVYNSKSEILTTKLHSNVIGQEQLPIYIPSRKLETGQEDSNSKTDLTPSHRISVIISDTGDDIAHQTSQSYTELSTLEESGLSRIISAVSVISATGEMDGSSHTIMDTSMDTPFDKTRKKEWDSEHCATAITKGKSYETQMQIEIPFEEGVIVMQPHPGMPTLPKKIFVPNECENAELTDHSRLPPLSLGLPDGHSVDIAPNSSQKRPAMAPAFIDKRQGTKHPGSSGKLKSKSKWENLRQQAIKDAAPPRLSTVLQAAFPEILAAKRQEIEQQAQQEKLEGAKKNWGKLQTAVMIPKEKRILMPPTRLASLVATALPDIPNLKTKTVPVIVAKKPVPYNTWKALMHFYLLCPAFDDTGNHIRIANYHTVQYRKHNFFIDGLHPMSWFCSSLTLFFITFYNAILLLLPYQAAYFDDVSKQSSLLLTITVVYVCDTAINLVTPKKNHGGDTRLRIKRPDLREWLKSYVRRNWLVDVLSAVPWLIIIQSSTAALPLSIITLLRALKIPSMMRRSPVFLRIYKNVESIRGIGNILVRIIPVGITVLIFIHFEACIIFWIGKLSGFDSWDIIFDHWSHYPGGISASSAYDKYVWMLSQCVGNTFPMTFKPQSNAEQIFTLIFIIFGAILYATFVGLISSAAISFDASGKLYRQKIDELTDYLNWKNIDAQTQKKLLNYYEFKYRGKYFEESSLLADMNESLRMELAAINSRQLIEKVPFLKREMKDGRDATYLGKIATALQPIYFIPGDYVINQVYPYSLSLQSFKLHVKGELGSDMYFVLTGKLNIIVNGVVVATFSDGSFFGEVALIASIPRTASVQAITTSHLYSLSANDFTGIIQEFDDMKERIEKIVSRASLACSLTNKSDSTRNVWPKFAWNRRRTC
ncbi:hypothetical protein BC830DRAFT_842457 [Chytriomyces sp. MP71]|nr:hypothetical protein BC830DRAFT_842457 [Chytriomyces sp. MP71]